MPTIQSSGSIVRYWRTGGDSVVLLVQAGIPMLVLSAANDRIASSSGRALAAAIPGARYVEVADAGHAVPIHRAAEINVLLAEHFADRAIPSGGWCGVRAVA
jgi:pimeloyl-ACP methyl ester carboxylesterase